MTDLVHPPTAGASIAPASFAQSRLWFLDRFEPGNAVYHIPLAVQLRGELNLDAAERAMRFLHARHETLRTTFRVEDGEVIQVVHPPASGALLEQRLTDATGSELDAALSAEARNPFDLTAGPLWRAVLWRLSPDEHILQLTLHHIISDGWSLGVLIREFGAAYADPQFRAPDLAIQYADFAAWQNEQLSGSVLSAKITVWCDQFAGADLSPPLYTDRPRAHSRSSVGATIAFSVGSAVTTQLRELCQLGGGSLFMALLTGFSVVMRRWSGREDLVIGTPVANRNRTEVEPLIGFFVNALPLRLSLTDDPTGTELFRRVQEASLLALENQDLPFEKLVQQLEPDRSLAHTPVFQVMFVLQNAPTGALQLSGLDVTPVVVDTATSKFDLTLILEETKHGLNGRIEYAADLFESETMARLADQFTRTLEQLVQQPTQKISELRSDPEAEREQLVRWSTGPTPDYPATSIATVFDELANSQPDTAALRYGETELSYGQVNRRANQLAHLLQSLGIVPDQPVGVCQERSPELIVTLLAILKVGGAYLALDPAAPLSRQETILRAADCALVITDAEGDSDLPESVEQWNLADLTARLSKCPTDTPACPAGPDHLAYISFTSGSTGTPKGVAIPHRAVLRLVHGDTFAHFGPDEVFLLMAPIAFDASTLELWGPLLRGGRLVIMPPGNPTLEEIGRVVREEQVTTLWMTAGLFHLMIDERPQDLRGVRQLLAGGDVLSMPHVAKALDQLPTTQLINGYGPTENTTFTCCHHITRADLNRPSIPIGKPIGHTTVRVLDANHQPTPIGVPGELYTGGNGLARGYVGQPELTDAVFLPDPHQPGKRIYRTGDRVRWLSNGTLEFLGRVDRQVKIRGHRIEPGEIESVLAKEPSVSAAAVMVLDEPTGKRLVGYVAPQLDTDALRRAIAARLPAALVPSVIVALDQLPLNANGKVDRAALPRPEAPAVVSADTTAPRTPTEEILGPIWGRLLQTEAIGPDQDFFDLGGHSLLATQLASRIREAFAIELPLRAIFESPVLADLAACIDRERQAGSGSVPSLHAVIRPPAIPLSFAQERLWFLNQLEPGNPFYNMPAALELQGHFDLEAGRRVVAALVERHESLRTVFRATDGSPTQIILESIEVPVDLEDLSHSAEERRTELISRAIAAEARKPFDLTQGPLLRIRILRLQKDHHILLMTMHHIVSDGWSMGVLTREMGDFYAAFTNQEVTTPVPLGLHYADYAIWQRQWLSGAVLDTQLEYWQQQLDGAPPVITLPGDRPRPAVQSYRGASHSFQIDAETTAGLTALSRTTGATLFMTLEAAFAVLLGRMARQTDVLIGTPIANRHRAEVEPLIGFFVNTLVLRNDLSGQPSFQTLLERTRLTALDAYAHQDLPFERLVDELQPERDLSRNPIFQVMFALHNTPHQDRVLPELTITDLAAERISAQFDIVLDVWETDTGLKAVLEYATDLFDAPSIERMAEHFTTLLRAAVAAPETPINQLPWLSPTERIQLLDTFNDFPMTYPDQDTLADLITAQAQLTPNRVVGVHREHTLTYAELDQTANQLAHRLQKLGVKAGSFVGLWDERGLDCLIGMVGILKAGGAFIPIDPAYPAERVQHMIADSNVSLLLTRSDVVRQSDPTTTSDDLRDLILFDSPPADLGLPDAVTIHPRSDWTQEPETAPSSEAGPEDPAYMLYTSGSTGRPKGAIIRHNGAINHIYGQFLELKFHADSAFLQSAPSSSDISVWQFLAPLLIGGRTVIADFEVVCEAPRLFELVRREGITLFEFVPVVLKAFLDHAQALGADGALPDLDFAMVTGEAVPVALINQWFEVYPEIPLANAYGPTEAADDVCQAMLTEPLSADAPTVPIGRPLPNLLLYVLDDDLQLVPVGVPGEICVSGVGVGAGYWGDETKTRAAFVPNPYADQPHSEILYRTGDLGRWRPDGQLEMSGRLDQQVKLRGFRIELGEIESMLGQHDGVAETVVRIEPDPAGEDRLVAWVTPDDATGELRAQLDQLQDDQVSLWQDLHEDSYRETLTYDDGDPTFNVIGWDSNYTREPLSELEMREYVDHTVERVRELQPRRILEIGAGTGLLMFPLARDCEHYLACDLSSVAIDQLRVLTRDRPGYDGLELRAQSAHDFTAITPASYDVVMLCSVVQYFPDITYLTTVIEGALRMLKPDGAIFLGDVRLRPLLPAFHASVQLFQSPETLTAAGLRRRVKEALRAEQEMAVESAYFSALRVRFPQITRVRIRPKRATVQNEMTRFRADVTLHVGGPPAEALPAERVSLDWRSESPGIPQLRTRLMAGTEILQVRAIANPRVHREQRTLAWLKNAPDNASVVEFRRTLDAEPAPGIEPEELLALADEVGIDVELVQTGDDGSFDAVFRPGTASELPPLDLLPAPDEVQPWRNYANHPLHEKLARWLTPQLRGFLKERLPGHMIPADFVVLEAFPQLPNGKIDRHSLPAPEASHNSAAEDHVPPANPTESRLAAIWARVLGLEQVGVTANFFELGGHSLKATQVVSRIRQEMETEVALRELFNQPTVRELASVVASRRRTEHVPLPRTPDAPHYPLSHAQARLWILAQMEGALVAYNMPASLQLIGQIDRDAMTHAFAGLCQRHEALRTTLPEIDGRPQQKVHSQPLTGIRFLDFTSDPDPEILARETALTDALATFDLVAGPLIRLTLIQLAPDRHVLLFNIHHIISDDWSMGVLVREFTQRYDALANGRPGNLPPLALQYRDYAAWQEQRFASTALAEQREFWQRQLAGNLPTLELATDHPRPPVKTYRGRTLPFTVAADLATELSQLAQRHRASLFMVLTTAVHVFLHRHTLQEDIILGTPIAGRNHPDLEEQIGFYINTLPVRAHIDSDGSFADLLEQVRGTISGVFENQDYPFDRIVDELAVDRDVSRSPLFDVVVVMQNVDPYELQIEGVEIAPFLDDVGGSKFDLQFNFAEAEEGLECSLGFNTDLFGEERILRFIEQFKTLIESILTEPTQPVNRLELLPAAERRRVLQVFNPAPVVLPAPASLIDRFSRQAERAPDAVALSTPEGTKVTYRELDDQSTRWARQLQAAGVGSEVPVGLFLERTPDLLIGLLAILKAGGAYVPIDPAYPADRIRFMVMDAQAPVILTQASLQPQLPDLPAKALTLEDLAASTDSPPAETSLPRIVPDQAAYIIYTSGSTGTPKGCVVTHQQVGRLFDATEHWFHFNAEDVWTLFHSAAFDFSVWEIWGALLYGGRLVVVPHATSRNPEAFLDLLRAEKVTVLNQTPSAFSQLDAADQSAPADAAGLSLRTVIFGGEALDIGRLRGWWERHGDASPRLVNMYGITETTVHVTYRPLSSADLTTASRSVIGEVIPDLSIYLLDPLGQPVPIGAVGEIHVGGDGVARGYHHRPELTADRFGPNPFSSDPRARLYRSGDLARWLPDGDLEYLGRADQQVKIRGFRIELGEIEATLTAHPAVASAVVIARTDDSGEARLIAYGTTSPDQAAPETTELRQHLATHLPDYMVPAHFVWLEAFPLTANGKVDRAALPDPVVATSTSAAVSIEPMADDLETTIARLWCQALGVATLDRHDSFFDLGGHSMMIVQVHKQLRSLLDREFPVTLMFKHASVAALAAALREPADAAPTENNAARERAQRQQAARRRRRPRGGES